MAKSERELARWLRRRLPCPQCGGEIERDRCMCDWCGAVVYLAPREEKLRLEGVVCFGCGFGNPGAERRRACAECGQPFAATCPGCAVAVPLAGRCCPRCGLSMEDFDAERARMEVAERRQRRERERTLFALFRWQIVVGLALMVLGFLIGRSDALLRRQLVRIGVGTGVFGALPLALTYAVRPRFRQQEG